MTSVTISKLHDRIDSIVNDGCGTDDYFVNIKLNDQVADKLYDFQLLHLYNLLTSFKYNKCILDGSDTGTGKTYAAMALCKQLNIRPFVICPKIAISNWNYVANFFGVQPLDVVNYEMFRGTETKSKYVNHSDNSQCGFEWNMPKWSVIIFDEAHKCKNMKTVNGRLFLSTMATRTKVLIVSATLSDNPANFLTFGYAMGLYKTLRLGKSWLNNISLHTRASIKQRPDKNTELNRLIYPEKGSRICISELGNKFPKNQISCDCYTISPEQKNIVNNAFKKITKQSVNIEAARDEGKDILSKIVSARQAIEKIKIPIIVELCNEYLENDYNVAIFVNFTETIDRLSQVLGTTCVVNGEVSAEDRERNIQNFQNNSANIIICNCAISESISLHDLHGRPRVSIISPSFSCINLVQTLGRIHRAGAVSPAQQRIIYCADTCEEIICNKLKQKLSFLENLNDNDLTIEW